MKKIKVLAVIHSLQGGGAEMQFIHVIKNLDRKRFDVTVCLFNKTGAYVKYIPDDIKKVYDLKKRNALSLLRIVWNLRNIIKIEKPRIIYSRHWKPNLITIIASLIANCKAGVVITEESVLSKSLINEYKTIKPLVTILVKWLYPSAGAVICVSREVKEDLIKYFGVPEDKCLFVPNMYDANHLTEKLISRGNSKKSNGNGKIEDKSLIITSMGRLGKEKGFHYLIEAIKIVNDSISCKLEIIGSGSELSSLKKLVDEYELRDKISFCGFQDNPFTIIKRSDIFVMASLFEGMSNVLLEAMALGMPIIYTDVSGVRDVGEDGKEFLIVPLKSPEIMAEKIIFLYNNPDVAQTLSQNALKKAPEFSVEKGLKKFDSLFLQLAQSRQDR